MKRLRENDSGYRIEPIGTGLGIWVIMKIEGDADRICKQPNNFTPVARMQPFTKFKFPRLTKQ